MSSSSSQTLGALFTPRKVNLFFYSGLQLIGQGNAHQGEQPTLVSSDSKLLLFSHLVVFDSLRCHGLQHARPPCPLPSPRVCPSSCPLQHDHPAISSSDTLFSFCLQFFLAFEANIISHTDTPIITSHQISGHLMPSHMDTKINHHTLLNKNIWFIKK